MKHLPIFVVAVLASLLPAGLASAEEAKLPSSSDAQEAKARTLTSQQVREAAKRIDALVEENLAAKKLRPARLTSDEEFVRRVYLDVTGTIPTMEQAKAFIHSKDPNKRAKLIDELLDSPGYVSHMYNYWADLLRITTRIRGDYAGNYQKWVKQAMADNMPYDQFVRELITASGKARENGAAGYWLRDNGMVLEIASTTAQVFLGTQIGCAQCHDHPFDIWEQKQFYELAAYTGQVLTRDPRTRGKLRDVNRLLYKREDGKQEIAVPRDVFQIVRNLTREESYGVGDFNRRTLRLPSDYKYDNGKPGEVVQPDTIFGEAPKASSGESLREAYADWLTDKRNPLFTRVIANRLWAKNIGIGIVEPVDDFGDLNPPSNPKLMVEITALMQDLKYDLKAFQRVVLNTQAYQRATDQQDYTKDNFANQAGVLRRMSAEQIWDSFVTLAVPNPDERSQTDQYAGAMMMMMSSEDGDDEQIDISEMSAEEILELGKKIASQRDEMRRNMRDRFRQRSREYASFLVRASEMRQPAPPNHFLREFGASARETVNDSHSDPSVPQVLALLNGQFRVLADRRSELAKNIEAATTDKEKVEAMYLSILSRYPSPAERQIAMKEIEDRGEKGVQDLIWALMNTREFMFVR